MGMSEAVSRGATSTPLLEETIGANLARTVAAHGDREAIVSVHQSIRWTYREFAERVETLARGSWPSGSKPATASESGARITRSGRCCSTRRPRSASSS